MSIVAILMLLVIILFLTWHWIMLVILCPFIIRRQKDQYLRWEKQYNTPPHPVNSNIELIINPLQTQKKFANLRRIYHKFYGFIDSFVRFIDIKVADVPSFFIRDFIYKNILGVKIGLNTTLHYGAEIRNHSCLILGKGTIVGDKALLDARNGIILGENVNISSNVSIYTHQHNHRFHDFRATTNAHSCVKIGNRAWIGPNVIILPGVEIGEGSVVGAGAVVTKNIAPYTINVGIPAKEVGCRTKELDYSFKGKNKCFI